MRLLIPLLAGLGMALFACGLPPLDPRRLRTRVEPYLNGLGGRPTAVLPEGQGEGALRAWLSRVSARMMPANVEVIEARLVAAGSSQSPESFRLDQIVWTGAGAVLGSMVGVLSSLRGQGPGSGLIAVAVSLGAAIGWVAIDRRLVVLALRRRDNVCQELPVALDLLTLSIMAGEAVPQALARVGRVVGGEVGREFLHVVGSIRSGAPTSDALGELVIRLPGSSSARLVDALCVGIDRGAPLAETLRAQAEDLRQERRRDLLESGGRREVLMLLPVVFLIMPTIVAFTLLPGLVSMDLLVP